jgi:hypothetical protein
LVVLTIRYEVEEEGVGEVLDAIATAFAAVDAARPHGIRYAYLRRRDSPVFIALLEVDDGIENPLPGIGATRDLQATVAKWAAGSAPTPEPFEVLGSYRMLG